MSPFNLEQQMHDQHIPGLSFVIEQEGTIIQEEYYGYANLEHRVPLHDQTVFEIASVTKLFTAQAILYLIQNNQLQLDDTLGQYLLQIPEQWKTISIQHCLTHQSGIPNYTNITPFWDMTRKDKTYDEVLGLVADHPLKFEAGQRYAYDNTGYYLLGMVIEAVSQQSYGDFLKESIFTRLNMTHTRANSYSEVIPNRAQGYEYRDGQFFNKDFYSVSNTFSAGVLVSNVGNLLRWSASLYDDSILDQNLRTQWWTPHPSMEANERDEHFTQGLGWFIVDSPLGQFVGHNGSIAGFASAFLHFRETNLTAIILCNAGHIYTPHEIVFDVIKSLNLLK